MPFPAIAPLLGLDAIPKAWGFPQAIKVEPNISLSMNINLKTNQTLLDGISNLRYIICAASQRR